MHAHARPDTFSLSSLTRIHAVHVPHFATDVLILTENTKGVGRKYKILGTEKQNATAWMKVLTFEDESGLHAPGQRKRQRRQRRRGKGANNTTQISCNYSVCPFRDGPKLTRTLSEVYKNKMDSAKAMQWYDLS